MRKPTSGLETVWRKARPWVRDIAGEVLRATGLTAPARFARDKLTIVTFHRVLPVELLSQYPMPNLAVTPDEFEFLLGTFQDHYTVIPLVEAWTRFEQGERPEKPFLVISFDDGQLDNLTFACPALNARGMRASFFVVADAVEHNATLWHDRIAFALARLEVRQSSHVRGLLSELGVDPASDDVPNDAVVAAKLLPATERNAWLAKLERSTGDSRPNWDGVLSWNDLRILQKAGHEIGSHTMSHPILPMLPDAELEMEIVKSREIISEKLGREVRSFCYPNGDHDERVVSVVKRAGYHYAVTARYGINKRDAMPYTLKRCDIQGRYAHNARGALAPGALLMRLTGQLPGVT